MKMDRTFISFIGKGRVDGSGYMVADYDFGDGKIFRSKCFAEAVRQCGRYSFDEVLFVGTPTSAWSSLLESDKDSEDLCLQLYERETKAGAPDGLLPDSELAQQLQKRLSAIWGKPVRLHINPPKLTDENSEDIFDAYVKELLDVGNDILLDITHGFRWMPILLTSALSFKDAFRQGGSEIKIIYGELGEGAKISPVRCLDILVNERKISEAVSLFFRKFEPGPLAECLEPYWSNGADAVRVLGMHIQGSLFLPLLFDCGRPGFKIGVPLVRFGNVLSSFDPAGQPPWVKQVHRQLVSIRGQLCDAISTDRLCKMASLLADRKLYGQAITALCLAAEHSLIVANGLDRFPEYDALQRQKDRFFKSSKVPQVMKSRLGNISETRNLIAHGGLMVDRDRIYPSPEALPKQFLNAQNDLKFLREYLNDVYEGEL